MYTFLFSLFLSWQCDVTMLCFIITPFQTGVRSALAMTQFLNCFELKCFPYYSPFNRGIASIVLTDKKWGAKDLIYVFWSLGLGIATRLLAFNAVDRVTFLIFNGSVKLNIHETYLPHTIILGSTVFCCFLLSMTSVHRKGLTNNKWASCIPSSLIILYKINQINLVLGIPGSSNANEDKQDTNDFLALFTQAGIFNFLEMYHLFPSSAMI